MVTQMGAYFFLASGVPRFGSSANAIIPCPATAVTAAAATANIAALRPLLPLSSLPSKFAVTASWPSALAAAFAAKRPRRRPLASGCWATAAAPPMKDAIMQTEAISLALSGVERTRATKKCIQMRGEGERNATGPVILSPGLTRPMVAVHVAVYPVAGNLRRAPENFPPIKRLRAQIREREKGENKRPMTKSGTEKKRVRRAPQNNAGSSRDLSDANSSSKKAAVQKDVYQVFAEKVRDNKQLESRWAIMQEARVEYFRGKDFTVFLRNQPELKEILGPDKDLDTEDIMNTLLRKNLIVRCDRVMKTVRPGKKKLSSWPAHLEIYHEQVFSENDAFFAWAFMKRRALWQTILSFLWPLAALAVCLFPVYPYQVKIVVLYSCAGALFFIATLLLLRGVIYGALWILLGKRIWFFPNINAEETTFRELVRFWPKKDEGEPPKWTSRLFYAIVAMLVVLLLRHHAPDEAARARYQKKVSNIIDDVLEWSPTLAISGMMDKTTVGNATESSHSTFESSRPAGTAEDTTTHHVDSDAGNGKVASDDV